MVILHNGPVVFSSWLSYLQKLLLKKSFCRRMMKIENWKRKCLCLLFVCLVPGGKLVCSGQWSRCCVVVLNLFMIYSEEFLCIGFSIIKIVFNKLSNVRSTQINVTCVWLTAYRIKKCPIWLNLFGSSNFVETCLLAIWLSKSYWSIRMDLGFSTILHKNFPSCSRMICFTVIQSSVSFPPTLVEFIGTDLWNFFLFENFQNFRRSCLPWTVPRILNIW